MSKKLYISLLSAILLVLGLTACKTVSQAPLDDAYYWPDKAGVSGESVQAGSNMEVISQQDTTITVRIKK